MTPQDAAARLLSWQPLARDIRPADCHCQRGGAMVSYTLPDLDVSSAYRATLAGRGLETCGYYCATCGFSNAGARDIGGKSTEKER